MTANVSRKEYQYWITEEGLNQIKKWASQGLTRSNVINNMGISRSTFYSWIKDYPQIEEAYDTGIAKPNQMVVNALFQKAIGTKVVEQVKELNEYGELVIVRETIKEIPPDTTAQIFWLKNRLPDEWKDSQASIAQIAKLKAETEVIELTKKKLQGDVKDTSMLNSLVNVMTNKSAKFAMEVIEGEVTEVEENKG